MKLLGNSQLDLSSAWSGDYKIPIQGDPVELAIGAREIVVLDEEGIEQGVLEGFCVYGKESVKQAINNALPPGYIYELRPLRVN